jgi:hypothetical protein
VNPFYLHVAAALQLQGARVLVPSIGFLMVSAVAVPCRPLGLLDPAAAAWVRQVVSALSLPASAARLAKFFFLLHFFSAILKLGLICR